MHLVEIEIVGLQALQALLDRPIDLRTRQPHLAIVAQMLRPDPGHVA